MKDHQISEILTLLGEENNPLGAMIPPIYQTSNFKLDSVAELRKAFSSEWDHHLYTRGNNPTVEVLRKKMAAMEGTEDAVCFSSGIAAISAAIMSQVSSGDHVICVKSPYSWTYHLLQNYLPKFNVDVTFVDGTDINNIVGAHRERTTLLVLESPNSMTFELQDLKACADWASAHNVTTLVDNSYCSPIYQQPARLGIDLVAHSGSKYLNGHGDVVFGVLCGSKEKLRPIIDNEYMTFGALMSPLEAFLVIRGLRTLQIRLEKIYSNTLVIYDFLRGEEKVEKIFYPFAEDNPQLYLAKQQMTGAPGLLSIRLKANHIDEIENFCDQLKKFRMAVSWGGHESLVMPIAAAYDIPGKRAPSLPFNHIRFYIGLEDPNLLIEDIRQSLVHL